MSCDASMSSPVDYLSHLYAEDDSGVWHARYNNGAKLLHRLSSLFGGGVSTKSETEYSKFMDALSGQQFALRHTPDVLSVYLDIAGALGRSDFKMPEANDTGEL